jgi:hypothetical protein
VDLEVDGEVAMVFFQTREGEDGVQEEEAKPMVCRTQILVSCNTAERWLEIRYPSMRSCARAHTTFTGRKWGRRPYWEIEGIEASIVASSVGLAWSSNWAIARRSFALGQRDLGEGGLIAPEHK